MPYPILPKNQLLLLFEPGDQITSTSMNELIEASYNPTLIQGSGIIITKVETPSGTNITITANADPKGLHPYEY